MDTPNPYAPPRATVQDVVDPSVSLTHADRGTRFAGALLDGLIFGCMVYAPVIFAFLAGAASGAFDDPDDDAFAIAMLGVAGVGFVIWLALTLRYMKQNSQSIAKKLLRIKVVRSDGSPVSLGRYFWLRNVVNMMIGIVPLYGFVDALFIFGEARQCLHDKIADTIVVNT